MGWGNCGVDSNNRPIGYSFEAICDHPECKEVIDRGLAFVCGDMHGEDEYSCEKYFCETHRGNLLKTEGSRLLSVCDECHKNHMQSGEWVEDDDEGWLVRSL